MGRVSNSELLQQSTPIVNHFSHQHQLQLFKFQPHQTLNLPSCSACNLKSSEIMYACLPCNYYLHQTCSGLPDKITHQSHSHQLKVTFSPPYPNQVFSCDICKKTGANQWLYRCDFCEFDAHLKCGSTVPVASQQQSVGTQNPAAPALSAAQMFSNSYNNSYNSYNRQQNQLLNQVFQQTSNDVTSYNTILQRLMAGGVAGGIGGTSQLQGLIGGAGGAGSTASQLQGLMGGAGGAGSTASQLQGLMGGAGSTASQLQGLMGGAGGAGSPFGIDLQSLIGGGAGVDLQSLMGGTGGAGTADLLQSLIGGGGGSGLLQGFLGGLGGF